MEQSPPRSAPNRRSMSPAQGRSAPRPQRPRASFGAVVGDMNQERLAHATRVAGLVDQPNLSHRLRATTTCGAPTVLPTDSGAIFLCP